MLKIKDNVDLKELIKELMYMLIWLMLFIACACLDSVIGIVILEAIDIKHVIRTELLENRGD